ncbi:uncharacterized protein C8A04DRAFT_39244 [Dichotomopilus funicola]|uniref:Uncharacterized protein n=1 Tax=Dichotomopilus funicola TaxID=1934379 RepID=A0AAN6UY11_9PEZI|nr:hypothetical protein C8A04DRAFT_39244 [Dichotomopilus funicola]
MPFSPPSDTWDKDARWRTFANVGCRDTRPLWADYWPRFNTITIPLLDEDAFFSDALAAAREAKDRNHLEELLAEKSKARRAELEGVLDKILRAAIFDTNPSSPEPAWDAAEKAGRSGSLDSFLQLASGVVWGWGEKQVGEHKPQPEVEPLSQTGTQEGPHMYSPLIHVSDDWDLMDHGIGPAITEVPASPGPLELPLPLPSCGTQAQTERATHEAQRNPQERSRTGRTVASKIPELTANISPESSQMSHPLDASLTDSTLPPSPSDSPPSCATSQTTPKTPPNPPRDAEVDIPQSPRSPECSRPRREGAQSPPADACLQGPVGQSKPRGKRGFHELEDPGVDDALRVKQMRRDVG